MTEIYIASLFFSFVAITLASISFYRHSQVNKRIDKLFADLEHNDNIEETITHYFNKVKSTEERLEKIQKNYQHLSKIAATSLQKTAIVRFNPFKNTGGDQSFALSLLDNHDNGFMLTSIHSREGTRVYIKPIRYGTSDYTLSKEEQSALDAAVNTKSTSK